MTKKVSALAVQQDGDHYKKLKIQPLELAYLLNATPCFTKLAKYASRRKVDRLGDLKKAIHCIQLEDELVEKYGNPYAKLRVDADELQEALSDFTQEPMLYASLYMMYAGNYEEAIRYAEEIIKMEFPDEA